jgi:hypothetical protein
MLLILLEVWRDFRCPRKLPNEAHPGYDEETVAKMGPPRFAVSQMWATRLDEMCAGDTSNS